MSSLFAKASRFFSKLRDDQSGSVLVYTALAMPVLLGVAGLSVDVALWHAQKRLVQTAADSAAVAGALELMRRQDAPDYGAAALHDAETNGYNAAAGDAITVNYPPASGGYAGQTDAVEVTITRPIDGFLSGIVFSGMAQVSGRAVASADINDTCVWALDPSSSAAVQVAGNAQVNLGCGLFVNSSDSEALKQNGASCLDTAKIKLVGDYSGNCITPQPKVGATPVRDPLESLQPPSVGACDHNGKTKVNQSGDGPLYPGVYCGDIQITGNIDVDFQPGLYILKGGGLSIASQSTVTGDGVTFYFTEESGNSDGISITGGATVTLSAPTSGDFAGVLFFQDRAAPAGTEHKFTGGSSQNLTGIMYFPNQDVKFAGGSALSASAAMLVAYNITFTGGAYVGQFEGTALESNEQLIQAKVVE